MPEILSAAPRAGPKASWGEAVTPLTKKHSTMQLIGILLNSVWPGSTLTCGIRCLRRRFLRNTLPLATATKTRT